MLCICHPKEAFQIMLVFFFLVIHIRRQNCNVLCMCHPKEAFQIVMVFFSCYSYSFAGKIVICCVYVTLRKHFRSCWYFFFLLFIFICRQNCNMLCICHPKEAFQIMLVFFSSCYSYSFADKIVICCVYVTLRKHFRSCWYFFSCYSYSFAGKIVICCAYVTLRKHFRSCWYFFFLLFIFICRQNCNMLCICHPKEAFQIMLVFFFLLFTFICRQNCNVLCMSP